MTESVPWVKWRFDRWKNDEGLRMCGLAARGLWADLLAIMHGCDPYGHLAIRGREPSAKQIASLVGMTTEREVNSLLRELEDAGVFSRSADGLIYNRRMVRDNEARLRGKATGPTGNVGGNPNLATGTVPKDERARPFKRSDSPEKTRRIFDKSHGKCHWCGKTLQQETAGHDFFHVDHVVPIRDGGGNDEDNLVAACAECNHGRARKDWSDNNPTPTQTRTDSNRVNQTEGNPREERGEKREEKRETRGERDALSVARPCRLPDGWEPDLEARRFAREAGFDPDVLADKFRDYWRAKAGKDGVKADWQATWRNWCRNEKPATSNGGGLHDNKSGRRAAFAVLPFGQVG